MPKIMDLTQIYRNIPRIVLVLVVLGGSIAFTMRGPKPNSQSLPLKKMVDETPQDVNLRLQYAEELEGKNQIEEARKQLLEALNFDPANSYVLRTYSALGAKSTNLGGEIAKMRKILEVRPDYQKAWGRLATLYEYQGKVDLANDARQKASELARQL